MAAKERAEAAVIADYLPAQLSPEEIADIVTAAVEQARRGRRRARRRWAR